MEADTTPTTLPQADAWLAARWTTVLAAVLGLAILLRVVVFVELWDGPTFTAHLHDQMDTTFFNVRALRIAEGDTLCREEPLHPLHRWHRFVGEAFFVAHPDRLTGPYKGKTFGDLPEDIRLQFVWLIWQDWYGGVRYHQEPFYVYFLAFVYFWVGENVPVFFGIQMLIGVLTIALMMGMTRQVFGPLVGALTGLFIALWGPQMHYEMVLLRTTFITFFGILLLHATQRMIAARPDGSRRSRKALIWYGVLIGLATTMKTTFLVFGLGLVVALLWGRRRNRAILLRTASWIVAGVLIPLIPIFLRNAHVGAPLFSMTSVGPITFAGTNLPSFDPWWGWYPYREAANLSEIMLASGGQFMAAVGETLRRHDGISDYLGLLVRKFLAIWHWYELPNNTNFYYNSLHSTVLTASRYLVGAIWVMPAALLGLAASFRRPGVRLWWWYLICCVGPLVVFYTLSRLRAPLMVGLMPFAAMGIVGLVAWFRSRSWVKGGIAVVVFVAMLLFVNRDLPRPVITSTDHQNAYTLYYRPKIDELAGQPSAAVAKLEEFLDLLPRYVFEIEAGYVPADVYAAEWSMACQRLFGEVAATYRRAGDENRGARYARLSTLHDVGVKSYRPR